MLIFNIAKEKLRKKWPQISILQKRNLKKLFEENKIHEEIFEKLHKKIFDQMEDEAIFLEFQILDRLGKTPSVDGFNEEFSKLVNDILKNKIELLGSYLKQIFEVI